MPFPDEFPADCPFNDAVDCNLAVFIVAPEIPVPEACCRSQSEKGGARNARGDAACMRHGLSVFPTTASCRHMRDLLPHLGSHVARAQLTPDHGKVRETRGRAPLHMTWWPYSGVVRHQLFQLEPEGD